MKRSMLTLVPAILLLAGCATSASLTDEPKPDSAQACADSLQVLAEVDATDFDAEDAAIVDSMNTCTTVDEYISNVKANPQSWGFTNADAIDEKIILIAGCNVDATTTVCVDATDKGILP